MPKGYYLNNGELVEDGTGDAWVNWNDLLDDESKTSQKIDKAFKKDKK
jgi:hypothetical protein